MTQGGEKAPNIGRRPTAGDYKGAQPPYRADKRAERAMSARHYKNKPFIDQRAVIASKNYPNQIELISVHKLVTFLCFIYSFCRLARPNFENLVDNHEH